LHTAAAPPPYARRRTLLAPDVLAVVEAAEEAHGPAEPTVAGDGPNGDLAAYLHKFDRVG
jgi:hypothetical protein